MEKIPKQFWEDQNWISEHMSELQEKYLNKWVAVVDKHVAGFADDPGIARKIAREKTGKKYIPVEFVESGEALY
jgi:hypothetical protein